MGLAPRLWANAGWLFLDNEQFQFGHALKPAVASTFAAIVESIKTFYVTRVRVWCTRRSTMAVCRRIEFTRVLRGLPLQVKGFEKDKLVVCTLLFEGDKEAVAINEKQVYSIAATHGGLNAGAGAGALRI